MNVGKSISDIDLPTFIFPSLRSATSVQIEIIMFSTGWGDSGH